MEKVAELNGWVYAMVVALLCMALTNAFIHYQQSAWADVVLALSLVFILFPTPDNLRFINAKLLSVESKSVSIQTLHLVAAGCLIAGLIAKAM